MKKLFLIIILVGFIACDDIIEVVDISKETISILAPKNGSVIDTTRVIFTWESIEDAENYHLQVASPAFENASQILVDTLITKSNYTVNLDVANYEWRIRAENSDYQTNYMMSSFLVQ